jgi:hypothetical protein
MIYSVDSSIPAWIFYRDWIKLQLRIIAVYESSNPCEWISSKELKLGLYYLTYDGVFWILKRKSGFHDHTCFVDVESVLEEDVPFHEQVRFCRSSPV